MDVGCSLENDTGDEIVGATSGSDTREEVEGVTLGSGILLVVEGGSERSEESAVVVEGVGRRCYRSGRRS